MRLTHVRVENHSGIPDIALEVRRHFVLVGANDAGKTSLLRLLDAVITAGMSRLYAVVTADSFGNTADPQLVEMTFAEPDADQLAAFADELESIEEGGYRLRVRMQAQFDEATGEVAIERVFVKPGSTHPASATKLSPLGWTYLPSTRSPDRELGSGRSSALRELLGAVDLGDSIDDVQQAIDKLHTVIAEAPSLEALRSDLATSLKELLPRDVTKDDLELRLPTADESDPLGDVDVKLRDGTTSRSLRHQSDGMRAMSTVALLLLSRAGAKVIAVDEPETHLHPLAQRRIGRLLNEKAAQAVLATHSSAVLTQFSPMDVVALGAAGGNRQLETEPFEDNPKAAPRWWSASALEPLTARALVLVEGMTDELLVRAVADSLGHDLDRLGVCVTALDGAGGFKPALQLFGSDGFNIPHVGLVDAAEAVDVADYLNIGLGDLEGQGITICTEDLEEECIRALGATRHAQMLCDSGHFKKSQVCAANGVADFDELAAPGYAKWCRKSKNKSLVAVALAGELSLAEANTIAPLVTTVEKAIECLTA